jgi:hypothetical protein
VAVKKASKTTANTKDWIQSELPLGKPKAVELEFHGMKVTLSRNPENGNMRLQIDALDL